MRGWALACSKNCGSVRAIFSLPFSVAAGASRIHPSAAVTSLFFDAPVGSSRMLSQSWIIRHARRTYGAHEQTSLSHHWCLQSTRFVSQGPLQSESLHVAKHVDLTALTGSRGEAISFCTADVSRFRYQCCLTSFATPFHTFSLWSLLR